MNVDHVRTFGTLFFFSVLRHSDVDILNLMLTLCSFLQFFFLHTDDLILPDAKSKKRSHRITNSRSESLADSLISEFEQLPKAGKTDLDEYAVINVSPSVVPNPYLPTFRVYSYNITEADWAEDVLDAEGKNIIKGLKRNHKHRHPGPQPDVDCKKKENKGTWACRPKKPHHTDEASPSRTNKLWTPLGYAQVSRSSIFIIIQGLTNFLFYSIGYPIWGLRTRVCGHGSSWSI